MSCLIFWRINIYPRLPGVRNSKRGRWQPMLRFPIKVMQTLSTAAMLPDSSPSAAVSGKNQLGFFSVFPFEWTFFSHMCLNSKWIQMLNQSILIGQNPCCCSKSPGFAGEFTFFEAFNFRAPRSSRRRKTPRRLRLGGLHFGIAGLATALPVRSLQEGWMGWEDGIMMVNDG
jgi:hypothetical protein